MDIERIKSLIAKREAIDAEIVEAIGGEKKEVKQRTCKTCGEIGHSARTCTKKAE